MMLGFEKYDQPPDSAEEAGVRLISIKFDTPMAEWRKITRADLVFDDVGHIGPSYEVLVYFNNKKANGETTRTAANGYAGRFVVFGHGDCFGTNGHCDSKTAISRSAAVSAVPQLNHPAQPHRRILTVTKAMSRVMKKYARGLHTVTLVTISKNPKRVDRKPTSGLFTCSRVSLQTYK